MSVPKITANCKRCLLSGTAFLLGGLLTLGILTITVGHFLTAANTLSQADATVVLGSENESFLRVQHAVDLFNQGYALVVVFSGGTLADAGLACSSAQLSLEAAQQLGLPADATVIGDHVILNVAATVSHDTVVGDFCNINPGVHLAGNVTVGEGCYIGMGTNVIQGITIGPWSIIGASTAVIRDIPPHVTAVGVPARVIKVHKAGELL